jgi:hypothetical protein
MIIFLVVNIGLYMSLFTSMMVTLYSAYVDKKSVYHMLECLKIRPQTQPDKRYSSLISIPAPLNVLLLLLAPFLLTSSQPEFWNKIILWVAYLPVLIVIFCIYTAYTVCLYAYAWLKVFFHKMVMIFMYSKSYRVHKSDKFMTWVAFAAIGPFRMLSNVLTDLVAFVQHCMMTNLKKTKESVVQKPLSQESMRMVTRFLEERSERVVPMRDLSISIREQLTILDRFVALLMP